MTYFLKPTSIYMETNILFTAWYIKILREQHKVNALGLIVISKG